MAEDSTYLLSTHAEQAELERLQLQERSIDWVSAGRLMYLGLGPGSRCLEAGVGAGSIARWMDTAVGENGHVVGIDREARYFNLCEGLRLDLRQQDLLTAKLDESYFDFVHCRLLLMHLSAADRKILLAQTMKTLKSGGWIVVCDSSFDYRPVSAPNRAQELWYRWLDAVRAGGGARIDFALGPKLPQLLSDAGFAAVEGMGFFALPGPSGLQRDFIVSSVESSIRLNLLDTSGSMTTEDAKELIQRAEADEVQASMPYGMAWARRP